MAIRQKICTSPSSIVAPLFARGCEKITHSNLLKQPWPGDFFGAKIPSQAPDLRLCQREGQEGGRRCFKHFLEYTYFSRLVKVIIGILQPFLCFFYHQDLFIYFFNLLDFYPVTRFLVTPLLVTRYCVTLFSNPPSRLNMQETTHAQSQTVFSKLHLPFLNCIEHNELFQKLFEACFQLENSMIFKQI